MTQLSVQATPLDPKILSSLITDGDCKKLTEEQRAQYYIHRCKLAGLDPEATPFQFIMLNGKLILYALKAATDQIAEKRKLNVEVKSVGQVGDVYTVTVRVTGPDGRYAENMGAVGVAGLKNQELSNKLMTCHTKAARRAILSYAGLGMLDETETQDIPNADKTAYKKFKKVEEVKASNDRISARLDSAMDHFINVTVDPKGEHTMTPDELAAAKPDRGGNGEKGEDIPF